MIRFPQLLRYFEDKYFLLFGDRPYAKYNVLTEPDSTKKVGFLTENTIFLIFKGAKTFYFEDHNIIVNKDHFVLLKKGIYTMSEYITETEEFEALMIFVPDNFLKQLRFNESNRQISKTNKTYVLIKPNELLNSFKIQYMNYFNNSLHNMEVLLQLKLQELFMLLSSGVDQYSIMDFIHSATSDQPVDIDFILKKHLLQPLTIAELAVLSGRSLAAFKRDFHEKYHCSPKQWINQQRLNYAHRALLHTEKNVGEIAYECGFENISHFIKIYKRQYGFTPKFARAEKATI